MKKILVFVLIICCLSTALLLFGCQEQQDNSGNNGEIPQKELNIIDDNYRNWYEIFVYSYYDTDGNGIGDLNGVTAKLDYIKEMGYNGIWLMPINPATSYHKYDVEDYYNIDEDFGTVEDMENLLKEAHARGIKVIMDLVVNHSSVEHPWFKQAVQYIRNTGKVGGPYGDYYVFKTKSESGYTQVSGTQFYYESRFWSGMPDLNLDSQAVKDEIKNIMSFWLNKGVDGFRLDAVTSYYTGDVNKNVEFLSWLNTTAKSIKPSCYIVGEAWIDNDMMIAEYYESGVDSFFTFTTSQGTGTIASALRDLRVDNGKFYTDLQLKLQDRYQKGILAPFLGNHDTGRPGSFMVGEDKVKMAGGLLAMLNGSTFVYYGEEIGMISKDSASSDPHKRIAMYWDEGVYQGWCYKSPENITITEENYYYPTVKEQQADENSILNYYKNAMRLRNTFPMIARGTVEGMTGSFSNFVSVIRKTYEGKSIVIVINLDREFSQEVKVEENWGCTVLCDSLCANGGTKVEYNEETSTLTMPAYSIAILEE